VLEVPETCAVNCCECPVCTLTFDGEIETDTVCGKIETVALADADVCAALWAEMVTTEDVAVDGALYVPDVDIVPTVEFPPTVPLTIQFTDVLLVPETAAVNCCDCPACKVALVGETVTATAVGAVIATAALAVTEGLLTDCAVMLTELVGTDDGALYSPAEEIVPAPAVPPRTPFTSQFTAPFVVPETVAVNCFDWPACTVALVGDTVTETAVVAVITTAAVAVAVELLTDCAVTLTEAVGTDEGAL
jgi:hypothetical protein